MAQAAAVAAVALPMIGSAYSTYTQYQQAKGMARQASADANAAQGQGRLEAARIRRAGESQVSSANAQAAANGLELGTGVVETVDNHIVQASEQDAWSTIFNYNNKSNQLNANASNYKKQARSILVAGVINTASQGLQAAGFGKGSDGGASASAANLKSPANSSTQGSLNISSNGWSTEGWK